MTEELGSRAPSRCDQNVTAGNAAGIDVRWVMLVVGVVVGLVAPAPASAQQREPTAPGTELPQLGPVVEFDLVDSTAKLEAEYATCGRPRQVEIRPAPVTPEELEEMRGLGKLVTIDPMTGQPVFTHLTDYLPAGWGKAVDTSRKVDSFGNPIVNEVSGLPGWAARDVEALRATIEDALAGVAAATPAERAEREWVLGNYLGQAVVRGIDVSDIDGVEDQMDSPAVADAVLAQMSFYEHLKLLRADDSGYQYRPSVYGDDVVAWIESHGSTLEDVLSIEAPDQAVAKAAPSGCYTRTEFTRGLTSLVGPTIIWDRTGSDDASADVPIGFRFYFYGCDDPDSNFNVRVSTNGYLTFFEQGGGAEDGIDFSNDPIPTDLDPDGYLAPNWDDLWISPSQGEPDIVSYLTEGAVGERVFTVEWRSVSRLGGSASDYHWFQAKLFEATGNVELHFGGWSADTSDNATVGMEDFDGLDGDCGPNCDATNTDSTIVSNYRFAPNRPDNNFCSVLGACLAGSDQPSVSGDSIGATGTDVSSCSYNDSQDVWFYYHAPVTGNVTFDTLDGTSFDTTLSVFDGCAGAELGCNDDYIGLLSQVTVGLTSGQDYFVRVAGYNGAQGSYSVRATPVAYPAGDTCPDAWSISAGFAGSTNNNTGCVDDSSCAALDTIDEWHEWTAPATGLYSITTCDPATNFDTTLAVYNGCRGTELACNDDSAGLCSTIELPAWSGQTRYIRVAGYARAYGNYLLTVTMVSPCPYSPTLDLSNITVTSTETYGACDTLTAGPFFAVVAPGDATFEAGNSIVLKNGFSVGLGASFRAIINPALVP